jgi:Glutamine synthetase, catalytic domain
VSGGALPEVAADEDIAARGGHRDALHGMLALVCATNANTAKTEVPAGAEEQAQFLMFLGSQADGGRRRPSHERQVPLVPQRARRDGTGLRAPVRPTINSYGLFKPGSWAPTAVAWGTDNRTLAFRVVGH